MAGAWPGGNYMGIIQVVPTFPPVVSGVGDYALLLAEELRRSHNLHSRFIVGDPDWAGASEARMASR